MICYGEPTLLFSQNLQSRVPVLVERLRSQ